MNTRSILILFMGLMLLTACTSPTATPPTATMAVPVLPPVIPTDTVVVSTPTTQVPAIATATTDSFTPIAAATSTSAPNTANVCTDPQVTALIDSLKTAVLNSDGALLASLVSPSNGMDVRYFRYGTVVNYDQEHAKFLFETTFEVDWGAGPGSGEAVMGSFHDVIVPELEKAFNQSYTLHCNELKYGGASYDIKWPYDKDFYSIYFPGTAANGNMDWHTWVAGVEYVNGKPYLYALTQYFWEP